METIRGTIARIRYYQEEGRTDWALAFSKIGWSMISILFPISLFRLVYDLFGLPEAVISILALALIMKIVGPFNLVMLDELLCRLFPTLRSAIRLGTVPVYDFRLLLEDSGQRACILKGELTGAGPMDGDRVVLHGRSRGGTFLVHHGFNECTASEIRRTPKLTGWILLVTAGLLALCGFYLAAAFDEPIYNFVSRIMENMGRD